MPPNDPQAEEAASPLVLVADDNSQARLLLKRILERERFRVDEANDGHTAIRKAQELHPDLILLDIQMPGIDGFEVVRVLREDPRTTRIPIIVVTAAARDAADVARGIGLGADDYLTKPFNAGELLARARAKIKARQLEDKLQQRTEELETLFQIGSEMSQALDLDTLADSLLAAVLNHLPSSSAVLALIDSSGRLILHRKHGINTPEDMLLAPEALPGAVLRSGEAMLVDDIEAPDAPWGLAAVLDPTGGENCCRSGVAVPLKHHDQVLGVLALADSAPHRFTLRNQRLLASVAAQAALAIRNAHLYRELQAYAQNLEGMVEARTAALQAAQMQLIRADKLAAIGTLAAGIAHEINNPLQPLLNNLEMSIEDIDADRTIDREMLDFSRREVQRIQRIVSRLLDFARPAQTELTPTDVNEIMRDVLTLAGKQLEHARVSLRTHFANTRKIMGSADQLKQVFLNLIVNAMDAMPNGGTLHIETQELNGFVALTVRDSGVGIPQDKLMQVFDPFYTTKKHGTGLGLSVSYGIIEGHGGQIAVESKVGEYTQFTVKLPVINGDSQRPAAGQT